MSVSEAAENPEADTAIKDSLEHGIDIIERCSISNCMNKFYNIE